MSITSNLVAGNGNGNGYGYGNGNGYGYGNGNGNGDGDGNGREEAFTQPCVSQLFVLAHLLGEK